MIAEINNIVFAYIHAFSFRYTSLDTTIIFFADLFPFVFCLGIFLFILVHKDRDAAPLTWYAIRRKMIEIGSIICTGLLSWGIVMLLKVIFGEARPFITDTTLQTLITISGIHDSFPSGHATIFAGLAVSLYIYHKPIGYVFMFGALLIGLARIASGIHYPIDILAGYVLGGSIAYSVYYFLRPRIKHMVGVGGFK